MKLLFSIAALASVFALSAGAASVSVSLAQKPQGPGITCPANQRYLDCGTCDPICNQAVSACTSVCKKPGCYCKPGYFRKNAGSNECVLPSNCPAVCPANQQFYSCRKCDQVCNQGPISCAADCGKAGCYCKDGYIRADLSPSSKCVLPENCPAYQCGKNEVYQKCGVGWQCENYCGRGPNACAYCQDGCYCKPGYIRSGPGYDAECILEDQCELTQAPGGSQDTGNNLECGSSSSAIQCGANEEFQRCGVGKQCEDYCGRGANACAFCKPGCYCINGYIRSGSDPNAKCIPKNQCPIEQKCLVNEVYSICGTACPADCFNRNPICTQQCVAGCFCKKGFIRLYTDERRKIYRCIPEKRCPIP